MQLQSSSLPRIAPAQPIARPEALVSVVHRQDIEATDYRIDATRKVFGRLENVTNTRYQEGPNFGTTGPAAHAGLNATW